MRGAVVPYQDFAGYNFIDGDDGTDSLGIIFNNLATPIGTVTTGPSVLVQPEVLPTTEFVANSTFGQPAVIQLPLLQVSKLVNPKNGLSVLQLSTTGLATVEYVQVIGITSNTVTVIRNCYPEYSIGTLPAIWPANTTVKVCVRSCYPEASIYDPEWTITKSTIIRYYQLMGYSPTLIAPYLIPKYAGERVFLNSQLPFSPIDGYANSTAAWPVEFNNPSTILANTHTWQYAGYFEYSRGLPKYQVNEISRKLQYDYYSTTSWGGRLTIVGTDQNGSIALLGPIREALTGNYYKYNSPAQNLSDNIVTESYQPIDNYPSPILVYSADDISGLFNGVRTTFDLTRGGIPIPASQLSNTGIFVTIGGVMQIPGVAYTLVEVGGLITATILFSGPPPTGASCDIRIVTSDDDNRTLEVMPYVTQVPFDGVQSNFPLDPDDTGIDNNNSFIFLSGVAQMPFGSGHPDPAYIITSLGITSTLSFLSGAPQAGLSYDFRAILSGSRYRKGNLPVVFIVSVDDVSVFFDNVTTSFPLYVNNQPVDTNIVNAESMFVTLGAVIQIPHNVAGNPLSGNAYTVAVNPVTKLVEITFADAPLIGTSCNIRVISSVELIVCPLPPELTSQAINVGPGITVNQLNEITAIDPGIINP
jgi:hypothetical protein